MADALGGLIVFLSGAVVGAFLALLAADGD